MSTSSIPKFITVLLTIYMFLGAAGDAMAGPWWISKERENKLKAVEEDFRGCGIEDDGFEIFYSLKGDRRITLSLEQALLFNQRTQYEIFVYRVSSCEPHLTSFWYKNGFGKNVDLGKGSNFIFRINTRILDSRKIRAWASKKDNLAFLIKTSGY